jgi:hypothetical protein
MWIRATIQALLATGSSHDADMGKANLRSISSMQTRPAACSAQQAHQEQLCLHSSSAFGCGHRE